MRSREAVNALLCLYKLTNLTIFAASLKHVPMGSEDAVLSQLLLKKRTINFFFFEENTRQPFFLRALARKSKAGRKSS